MKGRRHLVQLLTPSGERTDGDFSEWVADIGVEQLQSLYKDMYVARRLDAEATALQRQGELGLWAPLTGQEASQVGSARTLRQDDFAFASYREHAVAYCRGVDPTRLLQFWRGSTHSGWNPYEFRMTTPAIIVGSQALHATGYALGCRLDAVDTVTITYFGDGAMSQGDTLEALGFATTYLAPVVFFCQNNQWAVSEPVGLQSQVPLASRAEGFGMPSIRVDGNDVLAVMAITRYALAYAREGSGPTFIEASTYRMGPHTTSDDSTRYRPEAELKEWGEKDPIDRVANFLKINEAFEKSFRDNVQETADNTANAVRTGCLDTVEPELHSLFDNVYVAPHPLITAESSASAKYIASLEGTD